MPRSPTRWSRGTRTSSKKTALVRMPDQVQSGCTVMPGRSMGTIIIEMPLCLGASGSVRTGVPDLLPVDDPLVAVEDGAGLETRQVRPRVRLGVGDGEVDLAPEDGR